MKIYIGIVSEQALANLIPILMEPPDKVYLACSDAMASRGRSLKKLLARKAIDVEIRPGAPDARLRDIQEYAFSLATETEHAHPGAEIVLNATGGTKLMSLGFVEVFRGVAGRIVYTDTSRGRIEVFPDSSAAIANSVDMRNVLGVPEYLAAQGLRYLLARSDDGSFRERMDSRKAAAKYLGGRISSPSLQNFVGMMNWCAGLALEKIPGSNEERLATPRQALRNRPRGEWKNALYELAKARLVEWRADGYLRRHRRGPVSARRLAGGICLAYCSRAESVRRSYGSRRQHGKLVRICAMNST